MFALVTQQGDADTERGNGLVVETRSSPYFFSGILSHSSTSVFFDDIKECVNEIH